MRKTRQTAFTLIELLVVMAVIAILVGLTVIIPIDGSRDRAIAEMAALSTAIESYKIDNGILPQATDLQNSLEPPDPATYIPSSKALFAALYGSDDFSAPNPNNKNYLSPRRTMVIENPGGDYFADPWGNAYGYRSLDDKGATSANGYNVGFFDLWSTGGATSGGQANLNKWIVNWPDDKRTSVNSKRSQN